VIDPGDGGTYAPAVDPTRFSSTVDNPFLPFIPGMMWVYESQDADSEDETITVEVLAETRVVMGVETVVVHDVVVVDGEVVEDTYDWYAQADDGAVWYFGEDTTSFEDGVASTSGAWEAGVDGAMPGVVMPADPQVSDAGYRQEYYAGLAEDMAQIVATSGAVATPFGDFTDVVVTRDWTPLEPDVIEEKTYARAVGLVHETMTAGGSGVVVLVDFVGAA
jgi:hypothetical protein